MMPRQPNAQKVAIVMVGLPARGKTFVARKLQRYLSWLGHRTLWVNVGDYRRARAGAKQPAAYFAPDNAATKDERFGFAMAALEDLLDWFKKGGEVGIYDATNTERSRRDVIRQRCTEVGVRVLFVESLCDDDSIIDANVRRNKLSLPDYAGMQPEVAFEDFRARITEYSRTYEPVQDSEGSYVKLIDAGQKTIAHRIEGYLCQRLVFLLMQIQPTDRSIWLTRHGESMFNEHGRIGGDPPLTHKGEDYAKALADFLHRQSPQCAAVWTSTLQRTIQTSQHVGLTPRAFRALDEIDAGVCDGWTYLEIKEKMPDKFRYRYPRGESYADVIQRLEPVIVELERQREPVLLIAHQAVLRALYGYLMGKPQDECPHLEIPLHTLIELKPTEYGYEETRHALSAESNGPGSAVLHALV
jgi:broad specificity phosphatase PhoE/predicted kinase